MAHMVHHSPKEPPYGSIFLWRGSSRTKDSSNESRGCECTQIWKYKVRSSEKRFQSQTGNAAAHVPNSHWDHLALWKRMQPMDAAFTAMVWTPGLACKASGSDFIQTGKGTSCCLSSETLFPFIPLPPTELHGNGPSASSVSGVYKFKCVNFDVQCSIWKFLECIYISKNVHWSPSYMQ